MGTLHCFCVCMVAQLHAFLAQQNKHLLSVQFSYREHWLGTPALNHKRRKYEMLNFCRSSFHELRQTEIEWELTSHTYTYRLRPVSIMNHLCKLTAAINIEWHLISDLCKVKSPLRHYNHSISYLSHFVSYSSSSHMKNIIFASTHGTFCTKTFEPFFIRFRIKYFPKIKLSEWKACRFVIPWNTE